MMATRWSLGDFPAMSAGRKCVGSWARVFLVPNKRFWRCAVRTQLVPSQRFTNPWPASIAAAFSSAPSESSLPSSEAPFLKINLASRTKEEWRKHMVGLGLPAFRAEQVWSWVFKRGVVDFLKMKNLGPKCQAHLDKHFSFDFGCKLVGHLKDADCGTQKFLFAFANAPSAKVPQSNVEAVFIPMHADGSGTLCVSSQTACTLSCSFCRTGAMDKTNLRNLLVNELLAQVFLVKMHVGDFDNVVEKQADKRSSKVRSVVFMGMGEPLYNFRNVHKFLELLQTGFEFSRRNITMSTSGVVPAINKLAASPFRPKLAISLHATTNQLRNELVPLNKQFNIAALLESVGNYAKISGRRVSFEYCMLRGVNDRVDDAIRLCQLLRTLPASHVNLIPFNPFPESQYLASSTEQIKAFVSTVIGNGVECTVRASKGQNILGACGQLATDTASNGQILPKGRPQTLHVP